ncbi:hypothetical protein roselon_00887 [Roseibacterium elongatum DSM 19469]|uniref:Uncharacterized protein n=2 Tax=Roseicyclus elongatus TaxID=159346 RepID=W8RQ46_9RHOB|nr:hypothetical protein roselon_00887 [Roseibacterium elongatum DSM 19469]
MVLQPNLSRIVLWTVRSLAFVMAVAMFAGLAPSVAEAQLRNPCPVEWQNDGDCDEPSGLGLCDWGTDVADCSNPNSNFGTLANPCPYTNDGDCDEWNGLGLCARGTDVADCSNPNSNFGGNPIGYQPPVGQPPNGGNVVVDPCPEGFALQNGVCMPTQQQPPACPEGFMLQNGVCVPAQQQPPVVCPEGFTFMNGACQPTQSGQVCPPGQTLVNGVCQAAQQPPSGDSCPPGQVSILGVCQDPGGTPID